MNDIDAEANDSTPLSPHRKGIPFPELREGRCKFPLGKLNEPAKLFCGLETSNGAPYCSYCMRIVYSSKSKE